MYVYGVIYKNENFNNKKKYCEQKIFIIRQLTEAKFNTKILREGGELKKKICTIVVLKSNYTFNIMKYLYLILKF